MKFLYYPTNMHFMQLLCLKHGSTAQYRIQIFHYFIMVNLTGLIVVGAEAVFWLLLSRKFIAFVDLIWKAPMSKFCGWRCVLLNLFHSFLLCATSHLIQMPSLASNL